MTFNSPDYRVTFYRNGVPLDVEDNPTTIKWSRVLDDISRASLGYVLESVSCCEQLGTLEPYADQVAIWLDAELVWYGWVEYVEYSRDLVTVEAFDALGWLTHRVLRTDLSFTGADLTDIFEAVWSDAVESIGDVSVILETTPSGVTGDRAYLANNYRIAWDLARELMNTGVDAVALGQRVVAGTLTFPRLELFVDDFEGDLKITKRGSAYGNRFIIKGGNNIVGIFPPGAPVGDPPYPLVERPVEDTNVVDQNSADAAAQTRAEFSQVVPRVFETPQGAKLRVCDTQRLRELLPGAVVDFDSTGLCYQQRETFRLQKVEVDVSGSTHSVGVTLQPFGSGNLVV